MRYSAYLVGPFIGELEWEFYRFAPYIINLKKNNPKYKFIVYTRPSRFDLYGIYADILVPLNLKNDDSFVKRKFGIKGFDNDNYDILIKYFNKKYKGRFTIKEHLYPDLRAWRAKIKWQFPRSEMDYDFRPRKKNYEIVNGLFDSSSSVFICSENSEIRRSVHGCGYDPIMLRWLTDVAKNGNNGLTSSFIGCLIVVLRNCRFVVGNLNSSITKLALLLNIPVISVNEKMDYDLISLLNPFGTPVINCEEIEEGVDIYEDNFRFTKSWAWKQRGLGYTSEVRKHISRTWS